MADKIMSFEESMQRLEKVVELLEKGEVSLDESIRLFEEGTSLIVNSNEMLKQAEQKIRVLRKGTDGEPIEVETNEDFEDV